MVILSFLPRTRCGPFHKPQAGVRGFCLGHTLSFLIWPVGTLGPCCLGQSCIPQSNGTTAVETDWERGGQAAVTGLTTPPGRGWRPPGLCACQSPRDRTTTVTKHFGEEADIWLFCQCAVWSWASSSLKLGLSFPMWGMRKECGGFSEWFLIR